MKQMSKLLAIAVALYLASLTLTACGEGSDKSDEPNTDNALIVGTWRITNEDGDYFQYRFDRDGGGLEQEWYIINGQAVCTDEGEITYTYNKDASQLTVVELIDGDIRDYRVVTINASYLVLKDYSYGGTQTFKRVN